MTIQKKNRDKMNQISSVSWTDDFNGEKIKIDDKKQQNSSRTNTDRHHNKTSIE